MREKQTRKHKRTWRQYYNSPRVWVAIAVIMVFGGLGLWLLAGSRAASNAIAVEAESGTPAGNVALTEPGDASDNKAMRFGGSTNPNPNPAPTYPADISGPNWKVTLPLVSSGKVVEIKPPDFLTYSNDKFFKLNSAKDGIIFTVFHGGGTTSGSSNPRSELRERYNNDPEGYWNAGTGTHTMEVVGQVNRLTKVKPHVVIAQVHDDQDDVSVWRVEGNQLWLTKGDTSHGHLVDSNFQLSKKYTLKYVITNGKYEYYYNDTKVDFTLSNSNKSYFKAGNYLQSNPSSAPGESTSEYSEVVIYSVKVEHK